MSFLHQAFIPENQPDVLSPLCLRAQAVALLDKATWLSSAASIGPSDFPRLRQLKLHVLMLFADATAHSDFFNEHDLLIEKFILHLPLLDSLSSLEDPELIRHLVLTHMIARLAAMQLHAVFSDSNLTSTIKCLSASKAIGAAYKVMLPKRADVMRGVQLHADPYLLVSKPSSPSIAVDTRARFIY